jgi:hypothetical protein
VAELTADQQKRIINRMARKGFTYRTPKPNAPMTAAFGPAKEAVVTTRGAAANKGWILTENGNYKFIQTAEKNLPTGMYKVVEEYNVGLTFSPVTLQSDTVIDLPGLPTKYIIDQMETFWQGEEVYKNLNLLHKRGLLLYGEPGGGKTSIIRLLIDRVFRQEGIVIIVEDFAEAIKVVPDIRKQDKQVPIITLCEDLDEVLDSRGEYSRALAFYDGQHQLSNVLHIATTNYPEKIENRFLKRPGRFDLVIGIHAPAEETRNAYLRAMTKGITVPEEKIRAIVRRTDGMCISYLREIVAAHFGLGEPLDDVLQRLNVNFKKKITSKRGSMGFSIGYVAEPKEEKEE